MTSTIFKISTPIVLFILMTDGATAQEGLKLGVGRLAHRTNASLAPVSVKNDTSKMVERVRVECGFFLKGEHIASSYSLVYRIAPGATGYEHVIILEPPVAPDSADCRIVEAR